MTNRFAEFRRKVTSAIAALAVSSVLVTAAVGYAVAPEGPAQAQRTVA